MKLLKSDRNYLFTVELIVSEMCAPRETVLENIVAKPKDLDAAVLDLKLIPISGFEEFFWKTVAIFELDQTTGEVMKTLWRLK